MKVAYFGAFDARGYGGLVSPLVLERRLSGVCDELVHVSPSGGGLDPEDRPASMALGEFLSGGPGVDGVVLGGGDVFGATFDPGRPADREDSLPSPIRESIWLGAAYAAARDGLPLCWNAPDFTEELTQVPARFARWAASVSDYVSVRDPESRRLLQRSGVGDRIETVPDPVLEVSGLWSSGELEEAYDEAFARREVQTPQRSLVFDLSSVREREDPRRVAAVVDGLCERARATPVIVDLESLRGGDPLHEQVARRSGIAPLLVGGPRSLREVAALVAGSEACLGSSLTGMMVSCSFGRRGLAVVPEDARGFSDFMQRSGLSGWQVSSWEEAGHRADALLSASPHDWELVAETARPALDEHWERIRGILRDGAEPRPEKRDALARLESLGEEYPGEDDAPGGTAAGVEAGSEIERLRERVSELEGDVSRLEHWMEEVDAQVPALLRSPQWRMGRILHELQRRILRKPRVPTAAAHLINTLQQYRSWRRPDRGSGPAETTVRIPESALEARARRLLSLAESNRSLPRALQAASRRALASGKRRVRLEYRKLKPRMPREELAQRIRQRLGPAPEIEEWPSVSVVVLNRDGLSYLQKLFAGLEDSTDYPAAKLEVILVDNASTDGSVEFARSFEGPFSVRVIGNRENVSFSEGNNQGAELAGGELLLFANNDLEPFEASWLKEMVSLLAERDAAAVGARLLYTGVTEHETGSGYALQHRGVGFRKAAGEEWHRNLGAGEDALDGRLGVDEARPAVTAACMLVSRKVFEAVGGFAAGYRYGSEDVDLCLKLLQGGGRIFSSGRAVLFHDESPSQKAAGREFMRLNRTGNRRLFWESWGPELRRRCRLDRLGGKGFWSEEGRPHVALTVTSKDPRDGYGDWHTAHEMGGALENMGWRVSYVERKGDRWYSLPDDLDYLMVLIDLYDISRVPKGVTTIAWIRNWTERWVEHPWFADYDVVLASSGISRRIIEEHTPKKVDALFPIATNPERFSPTATEPSYEADYVFTGNFWGDLRGLVGSLEVGPRETFRIFGKGWENVPRAARYARGTLPYDEMPKVYSSAKIVIDDTASPTLPYGAVNSRVFDALATGTPVVTNCEAGVRELFDEEFPTYSDKESLRGELDRLLSDDAKRGELAARYQRLVLEEHTYEKRAGQLREILSERARATSFCIKIGAPDRKAAASWGDTHYARALQRHLEAAGHPCTVQTLDEWDSLEGTDYDIAIHLKGLTPYTTKPGQLNVLWNISHPEGLTARECDRYDLVFVASERWAKSLAAGTGTPVHPLQQATDPAVFYPGYDPAHDHELVFVGNSRRVERRVLKDLLPTDRDLAVWGGDWEGLIDRRHVVGEYLPNEQVRKAYSSAAIVLNDHWPDMREHGFISNRVYDALACGALVISDRIRELDEELGEAVVTYEGAEELEELVSYYLAHPEERRQRGERGRELVLERHTFQKRTQRMLDVISAQDRPGPVLPAVPGSSALDAGSG